MMNEKLKLSFSVVKRILQCIFVLVWTYFVCETIYNSTLFTVYGELFPNGVSANTLPMRLIGSELVRVQNISMIVVVIYLLVVCFEYFVKKDLKKEIIDLCTFGILAICIKIPQYMMLGFYKGNEKAVQVIIALLVFTMILLYVIKVVYTKKQKV